MQIHERHAVVLPSTGKAESGDGKQGLDPAGLVFEEVLLDLLDDIHRALLRGAHRSLDLGKQHTLIFLRQKGRRQPEEHPAHQHHHGHKYQPEPLATSQDAVHRLAIATGALVEAAVEPAEKPTLALGMALGHRLEQGRAQRRCQNERHQHRKRHG